MFKVNISYQLFLCCCTIFVTFQTQPNLAVCDIFHSLSRSRFPQLFNVLSKQYSSYSHVYLYDLILLSLIISKIKAMDSFCMRNLWRNLISKHLLWKLNTLRPRQNGRHFAGGIFKCIFLNENAWISIKISLRFVPQGPINNIPALVQIMAWRRPGDKPLSEPMMIRLPKHICVTRPQWVKCL